MSLKQIFKPTQCYLAVPYIPISQFSPVVKTNPIPYITPSLLSYFLHRNKIATPTAAKRPNPDLVVSAAAPAALAEVVGVLVANDDGFVPDDVTVDIVVEAVAMELVILPRELDAEPVELDAAVAFVVLSETEAVDEGADEETDDEAIVVESIANCPE
jgi:hypothetical protein